MAQRRRWCQFTLRSVLLIPPLVVGIVWWWLTAPERTAKRFLELMVDGRLEEANAMLDGVESIQRDESGHFMYVQARSTRRPAKINLDYAKRLFADCPVDRDLLRRKCKFEIIALVFTVEGESISVEIVDEIPDRARKRMDVRPKVYVPTQKVTLPLSPEPQQQPPINSIL